ncbi:MAG: ribbon-helix-helix protein, CopG family [Deltaproteobacteria bacterium]|nr:ribbon-helix-helix protein, CopG family [Deltaproteobacteria bacterium]
MRTIEITLDEDLLREIDRVAEQLRTSRSAFTRKALREALARHRSKELEIEHRRGYERQPVSADEFSAWESEHAWGDG